MGYTHYWYVPAEFETERFVKFMEDCKKICEILPIPLGNGAGEGVPTFNRDVVCFNGHIHSEGFARQDGLIWPENKAESVGIPGSEVKTGNWFAGSVTNARSVDSNGDGSYETFCIERKAHLQSWETPKENGLYFSCCKTNFRPYDLNVQCCLIALKEHFPEVIIQSDGTPEQWGEAISDCQHILGYGLLFNIE